MKQFYQVIDDMFTLVEGWDSYDAPVPSELAKENAKKVLATLENSWLNPRKVLPSAEGGVMITFNKQDRNADFECLNDGSILAAMTGGRHRGEPVVWEIGKGCSIGEGIERISYFINDW